MKDLKTQGISKEVIKKELYNTIVVLIRDRAVAFIEDVPSTELFINTIFDVLPHEVMKKIYFTEWLKKCTKDAVFREKNEPFYTSAKQNLDELDIRL